MKKILFGFLVLSLTSINVGHSRERKVVEFGIDGGVSSSNDSVKGVTGRESSRGMHGLFIGGNVLINAGDNLFFTGDIRQTNMRGSDAKGESSDLDFKMREDKRRMLDYSLGAGYRLGTYGIATFSPIVGFISKRISYTQNGFDTVGYSNGDDQASGLDEYKGLYVGGRAEFAFSDTHESVFSLKIANLNAQSRGYSMISGDQNAGVASSSGHPGFRNYGIFLRYDDEYKISDNTWIKWFAFFEQLRVERVATYGGAGDYNRMSWQTGGLGFGFSWK